MSTKAHRATFTFTGSGGVGKLHFRCALDGGGFKKCTSPKGYLKVKPGKHTFAVEAIDARGQVDRSPAKRTFSV